MINRRVLFTLPVLMFIILATAACGGYGVSATPTPIKPDATVLASLSMTPPPASPTLPPIASPTRLRPTNTPTSTPLSLSPTVVTSPTDTPDLNTTTTTTISVTLTPSISPTATVLLDELAALVLQPDEVPSWLVADPSRSGEQSNIDLADGDADRLQQLKDWGRLTGYSVAYQASTQPSIGEISLLSSSAALFNSDSGAQADWADAVRRLQASDFPFAAISEAPHYSDSSTVLTYTDPQTNIATYVFLAANGPLVEQITVVGKGLDAADLYPLASIVAARMAQAYN